jgi:hypothetical protein
MFPKDDKLARSEKDPIIIRQEQRVLSLLPANMVSIVRETGLTPGKIRSLLRSLRRQGKIYSYRGEWRVRSEQNTQGINNRDQEST